MLTEGLLALLAGRQQTRGGLHVDLVRAGLIGHRGGGVLSLQEGAIAAHSQDNLTLLLVDADGQGANHTRIDLRYPRFQQGLEACLLCTEVEFLEVVGSILIALGDGV